MALQLRRGHTPSIGKTVAATFALLALVVQPLVATNIPQAFALADSTVVVRGNDSSSFQSVSGWAINRDAGNRTPIKFVANNPSTGDGSLYVEPLSTTVAARKFIAENAVNKPVADVSSISIDYKLGPATNANQIYMNIYTRYAGTSSFSPYDCRYTTVASLGSQAAYSTLTFSTASSSSVTTRSGAAACPSTPASMPAGSTLVNYAVNLGDTSLSDAGMSAYFDNAVVMTTAGSTAYDFEPILPAAPSGLSYGAPNRACGDSTNINYAQPKWNAVAGVASYDYQALLNGSVVFSANYVTNQHPGGTFGSGTNGTWGFQVRSVAINGAKSAWSSVCELTLDTVVPGVATLETPANNAFINYNDFWFEWSDVAGAQSYEAQFSQSNSVDADNALNVGVWSGDASHNQPTESLAWSSGATGTWYWQVRAVDAAGNKGAWTSPWKLTIDKDTPAASITSATMVGDTLTFDGTVSDTNLNYYYCYLTTNQTITVDGHTFSAGQEVRLNNNADSSRNAACNTQWASGQTNFSGTLGGFIIAGVPSGDYTINLVVHDLAGNNNAATPTQFVVSLDRSAPVVTLNTVAAITNGQTAIVTGSIDDLTVSEAEVFVDGISVGMAVVQTDGSFSFGVSDLAIGTHTVVVKAKDTAGNEGASISRSIVVNAVTIITPVANTDDGDLPTTPAPAQIFTAPIVALGGDQSVLGDESARQNQQSQVSNDVSDQEVKGLADEKQDGILSPLGFAWYWWLVALAAIAGLWWLLAALRRRKGEE